MENIMYNLIFCSDEKYLNVLYHVFTTFIKFHNPNKFNIYFVLYDPENKNLHNQV